MSWHTTLRNALDVALRIPPLLALNSILNGTFLSFVITDDQLIDLSTTVHILIHLIAAGLCLVLVTMTTKQLVCAYSLLLTFGVLILSYNFNYKFVTSQLELSQAHYSTTASVPTWQETARRSPWQILHRSPSRFIGLIVVQCTLAFFYNSLTCELARNFLPPNRVLLPLPLPFSSYMFFLLPVVLTLFSMPEKLIQYLPSTLTFLAGLEFHLALLTNAHILADFFHLAWAKSWLLIHNFGLQGFAELQWERLHVPLTLRLFWLTRIAYHIAYFSIHRITSQSSDAKTASYTNLSYEDAVSLAKELLILGCDTHVSLLGMTSLISFLVHYVGELFIFIVGSSREEDYYMGTMSAILFFILALQTGLCGMPAGKRLGRLYCNACLLLMAMLHFVHGMVHPELLTVSAGRSFSVKRHARSLSMSLFLICFPLVMIVYLWSSNPLSTWLFAVIAFGVELVFKVLISLIIYSLFMIDAMMEDFWEGLDDYIYYVKSTGNTIEFLFGLFLFGNGTWILLFESGGTMRALMMCIHAYFNIWTQAKEGWKVFIKRRLAAMKISQLPVATTNELHEYSDVCAICYYELSSARVTKCHHLFHGVCLRKWLYIQDKCPLCHQIIYSSEPNESCQIVSATERLE